jgi:hypothetical protein
MPIPPWSFERQIIFHLVNLATHMICPYIHVCNFCPAWRLVNYDIFNKWAVQQNPIEIRQADTYSNRILTKTTNYIFVIIFNLWISKGVICTLCLSRKFI